MWKGENLTCLFLDEQESSDASVGFPLEPGMGEVVPWAFPPLPMVGDRCLTLDKLSTTILCFQRKDGKGLRFCLGQSWTGHAVLLRVRRIRLLLENSVSCNLCFWSTLVIITKTLSFASARQHFISLCYKICFTFRKPIFTIILLTALLILIFHLKRMRDGLSKKNCWQT
jgi:hypothetical protein